MDTNEIQLHFADECPNIGSGLRLVQVRRGKKWVYLRPRLGGRWSKMLIPVFEKLFAAQLKDKAAAVERVVKRIKKPVEQADRDNEFINREVRKLLAGCL